MEAISHVLIVILLQEIQKRVFIYKTSKSTGFLLYNRRSSKQRMLTEVEKGQKTEKGKLPVESHYTLMMQGGSTHSKLVHILLKCSLSILETCSDKDPVLPSHTTRKFC